jgi:Zn finger protein HypA/HybF involved in hydrogenase expression
MATAKNAGSKTELRTGWHTPARSCPVHASPLELVFDETDYSGWVHATAVFDHDDNRVQWHCAACVGSWTESYFLTPKGPDVEGVADRLRLRCPTCGSLRVSHACVPECCEDHECLDCGGSYDARAEVVSPGTEKPRVSPLPTHVILETGEDPSVRSGFIRDFRRCPKEGSPLELVFLSASSDPACDDRLLLAWRCDTCERSWTEPHFRHLRHTFVPTAVAAVSCPLCRGTSLASVGVDGVHARCRDCDAALLIHLAPRR